MNELPAESYGRPKLPPVCFSPNALTTTLAAIAHEYREAKVRKLVRLYL
jgi:hypothetical protein